MKESHHIVFLNGINFDYFESFVTIWWESVFSHVAWVIEEQRKNFFISHHFFDYTTKWGKMSIVRKLLFYCYIKCCVMCVVISSNEREMESQKTLWWPSLGINTKMFNNIPPALYNGETRIWIMTNEGDQKNGALWLVKCIYPAQNHECYWYKKVWILNKFNGNVIKIERRCWNIV